MTICANSAALDRYLQDQEDGDAAYEQDIQVAKELLGIDMEEDGLDSVLDCLSKDEKHLDELFGKVGVIILKDGGYTVAQTVTAKEFIEDAIWNDGDFMEELAYLALQKPNFASRVNRKCQPEPEVPDYD